MGPDLEQMTHEQLAKWAGGMQPGSQYAHQASMEFLRRQTIAAIEQSEAAREMVKYTMRYTRYMLWSVLTLVISSMLSLVVAILA